MMNKYIECKVESVEMNQNDNKKVWTVPKFEVLDGQKTYGGEDPFVSEDDLGADYTS